jgi:hypothetical protein
VAPANFLPPEKSFSAVPQSAHSVGTSGGLAGVEGYAPAGTMPRDMRKKTALPEIRDIFADQKCACRGIFTNSYF